MLESDEDALRFAHERWPLVHLALVDRGIPREDAVCCGLATMTTIAWAMTDALDCPYFNDMEPIEQAALVISLARLGRERVTTEAVDGLLADIFNTQPEGEGQSA